MAVYGRKLSSNEVEDGSVISGKEAKRNADWTQEQESFWGV